MPARRSRAASILDEFAARTGLTSAAKPRRYLWTDAFGVVLLVSIHEELNEQKYLDEAEWVVAEVERVLSLSS